MLNIYTWDVLAINGRACDVEACGSDCHSSSPSHRSSVGFSVEANSYDPPRSYDGQNCDVLNVSITTIS